MNEQEFRKAYGLDTPPPKRGNPGYLSGDGFKMLAPELACKIPSLELLRRWTKAHGQAVASYAEEFLYWAPGNIDEANNLVGKTEMEALFESGWCVHCEDFTRYGSAPFTAELCSNGSHTKDWH